MDCFTLQLFITGLFVYSFTFICNSASILDTRRQKAAMLTPPTPYPIPKLFNSNHQESAPDFAGILNHLTPIDCPQAPIPRKLQLSDEQLMQLLHESGGSSEPRLLATTTATAEQFPNLMAVSRSFHDEDDSAIINFQSQRDNAITKTKLMEDLQSWTSLKTDLNISVQNIVTESPSRKISMTTLSSGQNVHSSERSPTNVPQIETTLYSSSSRRLQTSDIVPTSGEVEESLHINRAVDSSLIKTSLESMNKQIEQLLNMPSVSANDLANLARSFSISTHPLILEQFTLGDTKNRKKRNADGTSSMVQFCKQKGNVTDDGFLHMCGECAVTTQLQADVFPRIINEVVCDNFDKTCLTVSGTPHGVCKQSVIHVKLIRRRPGGCRMMIQNGQSEIVDEWETFDQKIRSGCECFINKNSLFAPYVPAPASGPAFG